MRFSETEQDIDGRKDWLEFLMHRQTFESSILFLTISVL